MSHRKWAHWLAIALAYWFPLAVSRLVLNETVSCRQLNLSLITVPRTFSATLFRIDPSIYESIYKFGIAATVLVVAVVAMALIAGAVSMASAPFKTNKIAIVVAIVLACVVAVVLLPQSWISPHSCLSADLIELTAGKMPDDDAVRGSIYPPIGNTGASLKHVFNNVYRVLVGGWLLAVLAVAMLLTQLRSPTAPALRAATIEAVSARLTLVIFAAGVSFAVCMAALHQYDDIGLAVLQAYVAPPAPNTASRWVEAYEAYRRAVELHWGGVGSLVVGSVYLTGYAFVALRSAKWGVSSALGGKDVFGLFVKVASIGAPFLTAALQQVQ